MFRWYSSRLEFSHTHQRVLRNLSVDQNGPSTILRDFESLLAFLQTHDLPATSGRHQLPRRVLHQINALLARPVMHGLKKPLQKSYPHIHGLYLLVRATGLVYIGGTTRKPTLVVDDELQRLWESLNPTERYCTLLETWLLRGRPEIIGEDPRPECVPETFGKWASLFFDIPDQGLPIAGVPDARADLRYGPGWHNLGLLDLFGLISVDHGPPEQGKGWRIERVNRTPLGEALLNLLGTEFFGDRHNTRELGGQGYAPSGVLQPILQPFFPEWRNLLILPQPPFRDGTHIFKVSLGSIWRRIAIPAGQTLDALSDIILDAYQFVDRIHLYQFSYRNRYGVLEKVKHPSLEEKPWTSEFLVGHVPLRVGHTMEYLFDFGDWWQFDVTLEQVNPAGESIQEPRILDQHGKAPEQYPNWDE